MLEEGLAGTVEGGGVIQGATTDAGPGEYQYVGDWVNALDSVITQAGSPEIFFKVPV